MKGINAGRKDMKFPFLFLIFLAYAMIWVGCSSHMESVKEGQKAFAAGDWEKSVQMFQKAYQKNPADPEIKLLLWRAKLKVSEMHRQAGEAYLKEGRYNDAITEFQISIAVNPADTRSAELIKQARKLNESKYYFEQGKNDLKTQKYVKARESFRKSLKLNPNNREAVKYLKWYENRQNKPDEYMLEGISEKPVSLKFKKTPIMNVFEVLTKLTGINFIFDKDMVDTKVTLFMTDVSFDRFFKIFLKTNSLKAKLISRNTLIIYPDTSSKNKEYEDLQIRTFYLTHLSAKNAVALLTKILKTKDIIANDTINSIVVRGPEQLLELASRVIEANDRPSTEVILNVEILEVSRTKEKQFGFQFPESVTLGIGETSPDINKEASLSGLGSLHALNRISTEELLLSLPTATLNLLKQDGDTQTLANPQIRVKNGEKSTIHIGERVPLRTNRRVDTTGVVTFDYQYQDIGVKLDAVPTINMNEDISLQLSLEVSALGSNIGTSEDPQYPIRTRTAKSVLTLRNGEAVIIGGLISDEERETIRKIPVVGDLPLLGKLFTNQDRDKVKSDIIMAITPIVIRTQEIPPSEVTRVWSGNETEYSTQEPYKSYLKHSEKYSDIPSDDYFINLEVQKQEESQKAGQPESSPEEQPKNSSPPEQKNDLDSNQSLNNYPVPLDQDNSQEDFAYSIHVSSFPQKSQADYRIHNLVQMNYDCFTIPADVSGKGFFYRVFVGRFKDKRSALDECNLLKQREEFADDIHVVSRKWATGG